MKKVNQYIHYGYNLFIEPRFEKSIFIPIKNKDFVDTKPEGGLWASPVNAKFGWKDWCIQNDFRKCNKDDSFVFTLKENANVHHIYSIDDLLSLPKCDSQFGINTVWYNIDFEKCLENGIDAIELHLSGERHSGKESYFETGLYYKLYGWDCDSILIMNPDIVELL